MSKGDVLLENGDVEVTADDDGSESNLELRTKALDETNSGQVKVAADLVGTTMDEMHSERLAAARV